MSRGTEKTFSQRQTDGQQVQGKDAQQLRCHRKHKSKARHHLTPVKKMAIMKKIRDKKFGEGVEKGNPPILIVGM